MVGLKILAVKFVLSILLDHLKLIVKLGDPASGTVRSVGFPLLSLLCTCNM